MLCDFSDICLSCVHLVCVILQNELENEIASLKKAVESSELQHQELQVR